ncbi:hypothetical protein BDN72DRAFT_904367 [Pluteus cervinus]|uniref:Uncharacterized protein n=1 Tax=Pluteus cervinus TaxID=181527 RepID=A0ACD3A5Y9_9AGAR|nr:hypothetical protein BDN72DRAFT_904367 [Pluteus cervinus]
MGPWILVDSSENLLNFTGNWTDVDDEQMMLGSYTVSKNSSQASLGYTFADGLPTGTYVEIYGQVLNGTQLTYELGTSQDGPLPIQNNTAKSGLIWSTDLTGGGSWFQLAVQAGSFIFDYFLVTPNSTMVLNGQKMVLDDQDDWLQFEGNWTKAVGPTTPYGTPLRNTRTGSSTKGDKVSFLFHGWGVGVYGVLNPTKGKLSATFELDGGPATQLVFYNGSQTVDPDVWLLNQEFLSINLTSFLHNLTITVDDITESQTFWLDYVIYDANYQARLTPPDSSAINPPDSPARKASPGYLVGIIVAIVALIIALLILSVKYRNASHAPPRLTTSPNSSPASSIRSASTARRSLSRPSLSPSPLPLVPISPQSPHSPPLYGGAPTPSMRQRDSPRPSTSQIRPPTSPRTVTTPSTPPGISPPTTAVDSPIPIPTNVTANSAPDSSSSRSTNPNPNPNNVSNGYPPQPYASSSIIPQPMTGSSKRLDQPTREQNSNEGGSAAPPPPYEEASTR